MLVRRTLAALAIGAVLAGETAAAASPGVPEGMTNAAQRAIDARSDALNALYGTGVSRVSPDVFDALVLRGEGMNRYGEMLHASAPVASAPAPTSFAWNDFATGVAAAFIVILLTGGLAIAVRTATRKRVRVPSRP